jgi:hypothetical protein
VAALPARFSVMDAPLMLEHLSTAREYEEGRAWIQKQAAESGVKFA